MVATRNFYLENQDQIPELWLSKTKLVDTKTPNANAPPLWIDLIKSRKNLAKRNNSLLLDTGSVYIKNLIEFALRKASKIMRNTPTLYINKHEVALFPQNFIVEDLPALLEEIQNVLPVFSDGNNIIIPLPKDAPRDIPRILLKSKDDSVTCDFGFEKINIKWFNIKESARFPIKAVDMHKSVEDLADLVFRHTAPDSKMKRVGYIKQIFFTSENPSKQLANIIPDTKNLKNFLFNLTYDFKLKAISNPCNQVISVVDGIKQTGKKERVLMIQSDINTLPTEKINWDTDKIKQFMTEAEKVSANNSIYNKFFTEDA